MLYHKTFPLVADNEPIFGQEVTMALYDEQDLISNIKGNYKERFVDELSIQTTVMEQSHSPIVESHSVFTPVIPTYSRREKRQLSPTPDKVHKHKTVGQLAREASRQDIKQKKSAAYLKGEAPASAKIYKRTNSPVVEVAETRPQQLARAAERLHQDSYILVDIPKTYSLEKENRLVDRPSSTKKNSYDFLKKSQVYNYPERMMEKQRKIAQELNLREIEEDIHG